MVKIAIVGSQGKHWTPIQRTKVIRKIEYILIKHMDHRWPNPQDHYPKDFIIRDGRVIIPQSVTLLSGGCGSRNEGTKQEFGGGVDVWAEIVADVLGVPKRIYYSGFFNKEAYGRRNMEIARNCDVLYCIDPSWRTWSGGQWTMKMAKGFGKEVHLELIE